MEIQKAAPRITALLARDSPQAIIFRRGPSRYVQLIAWDTSNDTFIEGQWLCGRIYDRLCDLSPSGKYLIYFAAKPSQRKRWTAISKPPYLHALALWPDTFLGGGGYFKDEHSIVLTQSAWDSYLAHGFTMPENFKTQSVSTNTPANNCYENRLVRDGWVEIDRQVIDPSDRSSPVDRFDLQVIHRKANPVGTAQHLSIEMTSRGYLSSNPDDSTFAIVGLDRALLHKLASANWADWGHNGDLLYAANGKIFRVLLAQLPASPVDNLDANTLANFTDSRFKTLEAPDWAKSW
ncbi:MAG: hypothetical protein IPO31_02525 [Candidatus Obscuribacter sp.]|jgi:hypothetical protein|nr:hypothetical protein [Candidatus Obscuribacter sp.]